MDNYYHECPPMMEDGRLFTDFRSSQVREELFRYKHCVATENETRSLRITHADNIMDDEWNHLRNNKSCFTQKQCFHKHPTTRVTSVYNNAELLAYNGELSAPTCDVSCYDYRLTVTPSSKKGRTGCKPTLDNPNNGYPVERCPSRCSRTKRMRPERLYIMDKKY